MKKGEIEDSSDMSTKNIADSIESRLKEVKVAGGSIVDDKPCFSTDSRFFFVINDGKVHAYNTSTGELAHCVETKSQIVAVVPDSPNYRQIITCDIEATVVVWDFQVGTSVKKWSLSWLTSDGSTVAGLLRPAGAAEPLVLLQRSGTTEPTADLVRTVQKRRARKKAAADPTSGDRSGADKSSGDKSGADKSSVDRRSPGEPDGDQEPAQQPAGSDEAKLGGETSRRAVKVLVGVRRGASGRWEVETGWEGRMVAGVVKPDEILVRNLWQKDATSQMHYNTLRTDADRPFTCVACHPAEATVAAGDASGRLLVWRGLLTGLPPVHTVLHWHTLPLPSVAFSPEGTYLVSGGDECVLVYWHGHDQKPTFVPRLGMPIRHVTVSPDNQLVATSHADNVIRLVTPQRQVVRTVRGLTWGARGDPDTGLVLEPRTGALLLNGAIGHLQLFSPHERKDLFSLDVVQTNYLTRERDSAPVTCDVTRAAVTSDGAWLATLEERDDGVTTAERRIKFWEFDEAQQSYVLNTCVEDPHEGALTALEFQPGPNALLAPLAVTTGTDGAIKYWSLVDDSDIYGSRRCWSCDAVGSHRRQPAGCAAFSADGARLAVGFGPAVTVWDPERNRLEHTLSSVALRDPVRQVAFGRGECCHLLVARADSGLRVWNLETVTLSARIDIRVTLLAVDPRSEYMAAFSASNKVFVFRPSSSRPVHQAALARRVSAACFVPQRSPRDDLPAWQRHSQLFFITDQQALHTLDAPGSGDLTAPGPRDVISSQLTPTPFSALLAEQSRSAVTPGEVRSRSEATPGGQRVLEMLESPSHTLPPLTRVCGTFLEAVLYPKESEPEEEAAGERDTATDAAPPSGDPQKSERKAPSVEARLDHLLASDMTWLTV